MEAVFVRRPELVRVLDVLRVGDAGLTPSRILADVDLPIVGTVDPFFVAVIVPGKAAAEHDVHVENVGAAVDLIEIRAVTEVGAEHRYLGTPPDPVARLEREMQACRIDPNVRVEAGKTVRFRT